MGRLLSIAHKNSQRLGRLLNDILDIEKLESGKAVFFLTRVDTRGLVEQAIEESHPYAESLGVTMGIDASPTVSELHVDPDRFVQVITNLLSNAIRFSPSGEEVVISIIATG